MHKPRGKKSSTGEPRAITPEHILAFQIAKWIMNIHIRFIACDAIFVSLLPETNFYVHKRIVWRWRRRSGEAGWEFMSGWKPIENCFSFFLHLHNRFWFASLHMTTATYIINASQHSMPWKFSLLARSPTPLTSLVRLIFSFRDDLLRTFGAEDSLFISHFQPWVGEATRRIGIKISTAFPSSCHNWRRHETDRELVISLHNSELPN